MTAAVPSFSQIKTRVATIRQKVPQARVIGIHSLGRWTGDSAKPDGEENYRIIQCDSPLAMRLALRQPVDDRTIKVLITPLEDKDLSEDILLRLAKRRLFEIKSWEIVRSLFQAQVIDPRLSSQGWIAELLLELASGVPGEEYPAARGGFLDADTVWPVLLQRVIGLSTETPDLTSLLRWSLDAEATASFRRSPQAFRQGAAQWLSEKAGSAAEVILGCVGRLDRPDAVPLGLALEVVFHPAATGKLDKAAGKLEERYLGGTSLDPALMRRWSTAATEVVRALRHTEARAYRQTLQRADEILTEVQAEAFACLSGTSPLSFNQRLTRFSQQLDQVLAERTWDRLDELLDARQAVREHDLAAREDRQMERVDMAVRLVRWLGERSRQAGTEPQSFAEAATQYLRDGGFVDWARLSLRAGDPVQKVSEAYARLFEVVTKIREGQSKQFAGLLADWTAAGSQAEDVLPVEEILQKIVAPLADAGPVLVIVIDGMSVAVCRELLADLTRHDWVALCEPQRSFNRPGIATVPSVTEFSRTSLLSGRLQAGSANEERIGFAEHPALVAKSRSGSPPVLFHKPALQETEDAVLAADVRREIASTQRRIVGVVVNAVDDHLLKGEQMDVRWSRDEIKVLPALLHEARMARRLVILLSDHGHVLDCQAQARPCDGGERWRAASGQPGPDELLIEGPRVFVEGQRLIAPWSERVRYGIKKNGYHGGLSPQEMVMPIAVLSSTEDFPAGWHEQPVDTPAWWDEPSQAAAGEQPVPPLKPKAPPAGMLFDVEGEPEPEQVPTATEPVETVPQWITRLLASPVFEEQKRLGGRGLPGDELFTKLLAALDRRGGKMTSVALARALEFPAMRLPGLLAKVQRVLNIDGYGVLGRDDASDTVELNRKLLLKQFDLV